VEADQQVARIQRVDVYTRLVARIFRRAFWDRLPLGARGLMFLLVAPLLALTMLGRWVRRTYASEPRVVVRRSGIEVRDGDRRIALGAPLGFAVRALRGGGARVDAALDDDTRVELPLAPMNVVEAEEVCAELTQQLEHHDRYR
jgi:hypothetical protein